jgi:hypothetical protein
MADWGGNSDPSEPRLPRRLADDLGELYRPPATIPPEVDAEILESAGVRCREVRVRRQIRYWSRVGAAAAVLFVAVAAYRMWERPPAGPLPTPLAGIRDIDRSGRVDILDAFALARHIERGDRLDPRWDVNGDGVVDQTDVDLVATTAVRINRGASS